VEALKSSLGCSVNSALHTSSMYTENLSQPKQEHTCDVIWFCSQKNSLNFFQVQHSKLKRIRQ
jgi:hypothetical protein